MAKTWAGINEATTHANAMRILATTFDLNIAFSTKSEATPKPECLVSKGTAAARATRFYQAAMSVHGRQVEVANGRFGAFQFAESGFG